MDWKDLGAALANLAPTVGSLFGPVGAGVGVAVSALAKAFGLKPNAKPDEILEAVKADPQALLKLEQARLEYELALEKENTERLKAELADVQNARSREIEIVKVTGKRELNQYVLAWTVIVGFFALTIALMRFTLPQGISEVTYMLFGALATGFATVLNYFFGSSRGSAEKTKLLAQNRKE